MDPLCTPGPLLGQYLVDVMPPAFHWKMSFAVAAVLGLIVAVLLALTARDPKRGQHEEGLRARYVAYFSIPPNTSRTEGQSG